MRSGQGCSSVLLRIYALWLERETAVEGTSVAGERLDSCALMLYREECFQWLSFCLVAFLRRAFLAYFAVVVLLMLSVFLLLNAKRSHESVVFVAHCFCECSPW
jgi:hypothetical protein